jgi:hypothetical protein
VLDDSLEERRDVATRFASEFALDPSCSGLKLVLYSTPGFEYPRTPYWALDVYNSPGMAPDSKVVVWVIAHGGGSSEGYAIGAEPSVAEPVRKVCFIVKGKGGQVR